ncbi:hypothetical protein [Ralstonia phage RP13]|nr:hypothetical protein [Ralstonia phage RP13]
MEVQEQIMMLLASLMVKNGIKEFTLTQEDANKLTEEFPNGGPVAFITPEGDGIKVKLMTVDEAESTRKFYDEQRSNGDSVN